MATASKIRKVFYPSPGRVIVCGKITKGITAVAATKCTATIDVAAGADVVLTAITAGTAANTKTIEVLGDGLAQASVTITFGAADLVITANTGGTAANGLYVHLVDGGTAGSEIATVTAGGDLVVVVEDGVSTITQVAAAIHAATATVGFDSVSTSAQAVSVGSETFAEGTEACYVAFGANTLVIHYQDTVSTSQDVVDAITASTSVNKWADAALGTGSSAAMTAADDQVTPAEQFSTGASWTNKTAGTAGNAATAATIVSGSGFTVSNVSAGIVRVTPTDKFGTYMVAGFAMVLAASAADSHAMIKGWDTTSKYCDIKVIDANASPTLQVADATLYFALILQRTS